MFYSYMDNFKVALWSFNFSFIFIVRVFRVEISREYLRQNKKRKPRTRFLFSWCGRQELKIYDDKKKALIFKAFLLLNAKMDAKNFYYKIKKWACHVRV